MNRSLFRARFVRFIVVLSGIVWSMFSSAENFKVTVSTSEYELLQPVFEEIEKGFEMTPHTVTWVQLSAEETLDITTDTEYDGTFGSIPLGSPVLEHVVQVPVPLLKQALFPIVLEQTQCPTSFDSLSKMQVIGIEHFDAFATAERRIGRPIPRLGSLAGVIEAIKTGEADASISIDFMLAGLEESFEADLKLCKELRIKSFVYYLYLHTRHAYKVESIKSALEKSF